MQKTLYKEIVTDVEVLKQKAELFCYDDPGHLDVVEQLIATAEFNRDRCAGLAAIQIGEPLALFVVKLKGDYYPFINPEIIALSGPLETKKERCLSFPDRKDGTPVSRRKTVKISYCDETGRKHEKTFKGFKSRVIQHEHDHLQGVLI
jgi:peptide deformylase